MDELSKTDDAKTALASAIEILESLQRSYAMSEEELEELLRPVEFVLSRSGRE